MHCPICGKPVTWKGNSFRPFCSERCKLIDLDNWLSERYRISAPSDTHDGNPSEEPPEPNRKRD